MKFSKGRKLVAALVLAGTVLGAQEEAVKLQQEIAAALAVAEVDGDLEKANRELLAIEERIAMLQPRHTSMPKLLQARASVLERLGRLEEAALLLEKDEGLKSEAQRLRSKATAAQGKQDPSTLEEIVRECVRAKHWDRLRTIGSPVAEPMARVVLETAGGMPEEDDPLYWLLELDGRTALRLMTEHFEAGGVLWKRRILRAFRYERNPDWWTQAEPYLCMQPERLVVFEKLLRTPETATDTVELLAQVEDRDALTPGLVAALVEGLKTRGPDFVAAVVGLFDNGMYAAGSQPVLEALLATGDARLRLFAAQLLLSYQRSDALLACATDKDPAIRRTVATALGMHSGRLAEGGRMPVSRNWGGPIGERDVPVLRKLLADEDQSIRSIAASSLGELAKPLEPALYATLAKDPAPAVRRALVALYLVPEDARASLLEILAGDGSADVLADLDRLLYQVSGEGGYSTSELARDPRPYLPALSVRWAATQVPFNSDLRETCRKALAMSPEGLRAVVGWELRAGNQTGLRILEQFCSAESLIGLPDELLARFLASAQQAWGGPFEDVWQAIHERRPRPSAALRLLIADENASRTVRLAAAALAADGSVAYREALLKLLALPSWKERPIDDSERKQLATAARSLPPADHCELALRVVRDPALDFDVVTCFVGQYPLDAPKSPELTKLVLERWFKPELPPCAAVQRALEHLGTHPELAEISVLDDALLQPAYSIQALRSMAALRNVAYLHKLARGLTADWVPASDRVEVQREAAKALASFEDPAAAEYLLLGLKSGDDSVRERCKKGLERIEEYETHARAWRERAQAAPTKESALAELLTMLADQDAELRAQAALGLGTLGAVETIPELIRLLKDGDASVRAAAQKALDRLNAPPPAPAGG